MEEEKEMKGKNGVQWTLSGGPMDTQWGAKLERWESYKYFTHTPGHRQQRKANPPSHHVTPNIGHNQLTHQ